MNDSINPNHYKATIKGIQIDVFDVARAFKIVDPEQIVGLRYWLRAHNKGDKVEQIQKAIKCGERWIDNELNE